MTIGIWGDSITFGSCDTAGLGWPGRLRKNLPINDDWQLYNFGICGETTEELLQRFSIEAQAIEPEKIIFAIGINDSKFPNESQENCVDIISFRANLVELIQKAQRHTNNIVFIGLTKVDSNWRSTKGSRFLNEEIEKYDNCIEQVAGEHKLSYIPMFELLNTDTDLADGLHPNADGYQKMFTAIQQQLH